MARAARSSSRTDRSTWPLVAPSPSREEVSAGSPATSGGWSHSWDTPTSSPPPPRAQTISVADGSSETIRTRSGAAADGDLGGDQDAGGGGRALVDLAQAAADELGRDAVDGDAHAGQDRLGHLLDEATVEA